MVFSLIRHSLDKAVHNAWQLYHIDGGDLDHLQYRKSIATSLLDTYGRKKTENPVALDKITAKVLGSIITSIS